jgi:hypothetical protein
MASKAWLLTFLALLPAPAMSQGTVRPPARPTVLELFTSQGCSSCPPADALLKTFVGRSGLMVLSFPVDYWDHLGWKDTLASSKNSARQKSYAKALGIGNVYTPQAVIDGRFQAIGSKKTEIEAAIAKALRTADPKPVPLEAAIHAKRMVIEVGARPSGGAATVWLAVVSPQVEVEIKRGENRGKTLTYVNVVRDITAIGMWSGAAMKIELPLSPVMQAGDLCAVLLQEDEGGRVMAAEWMKP